ncbi:MAG: pyridoxal 5'-phosphate synthase glutaminase subunit PdxT [Chloroflexi bacterium]|nr:MAG: pyridoxal 5'-phosphate synthase glutaminase subunit PdxT [Chloroflexota bacterium]
MTPATSNTRASLPTGERALVGVLALQGDFAEHIASLHDCGVDGIEAVEVRTLAQLNAVDGLIVPGGESTTIARLLIAFDLMDPLRDRIRDGLPVWGTCAGAIMLATEVTNLDRPPIAAMDITVERNAFGRQIDSFEEDLDIAGMDGPPMRAVFIRAPVITRTGTGVEVLSRLHDGRVVAARQGRLLATSFHPELTPDHRMHALFARMVLDAVRQRAAQPAGRPAGGPA